MTRFLIPDVLWDTVRVRLLQPADESCAVFLTRPAVSAETVLVHAEIDVAASAYLRRAADEAELSPAFVFDVTERARAEGSGLLFVHTHPGTIGAPAFSDRDDLGEQQLAAYLDTKLPDRRHASMILAPDGCRARLIGGREVEVKAVGAVIRSICEPDPDRGAHIAALFDRQVRAFGAAGQRLIGALRVGLVGVGGTGSVCAQELAYLGVRSFTLIDPKVIDETNLNRVVSAGSGDVGKPKVLLCEQMIRRICGDVEVDAIQGSIIENDNVRHLADCDFVFLCTDDHSSRLEASRFCYQNFIPAIDVGVAIGAAEGKIASIAGRVQQIGPGLPCLLCTNSIDADAVRRETMSDAQRAADPYFGSGGEPQPAVISLNATMTSLAITMFLATVTGLPVDDRHLRYDGLRSQVYPVTANAHPSCLICSAEGALGKGASAS